MLKKNVFYVYFLLLLLVNLCIWSLVAEAREPGQANNYNAGNTIGLPVAANPPPGIYYLNEANYYNAATTAPGSSNTAGQPRLESLVEMPRVLWSTPWTFLGATELMFIGQPLVYSSLDNLSPPNPPGTHSKLALANTVIEPINLSWNWGQGLFTSIMFGFLPPVGQYDKNTTISIGDNFWTFSPEAAISYVANDWDLTLHFLYNTNTRNQATNYRSGDQVFLDGTATRKFKQWETGLVGYYVQQVTSDDNGATFYPASLPLTKPMQLALGFLLGYKIGKVNLQSYYTYDIVAHDGGNQGSHIWTRIMVPIA